MFACMRWHREISLTFKRRIARRFFVVKSLVDFPLKGTMCLGQKEIGDRAGWTQGYPHGDVRRSAFGIIRWRMILRELSARLRLS